MKHVLALAMVVLSERLLASAIGLNLSEWSHWKLEMAIWSVVCALDVLLSAPTK